MGVNIKICSDKEIGLLIPLPLLFLWKICLIGVVKTEEILLRKTDEI